MHLWFKEITHKSPIFRDLRRKARFTETLRFTYKSTVLAYLKLSMYEYGCSMAVIFAMCQCYLALVLFTFLKFNVQTTNNDDALKYYHSMVVN